MGVHVDVVPVLREAAAQGPADATAAACHQGVLAGGAQGSCPAPMPGAASMTMLGAPRKEDLLGAGEGELVEHGAVVPGESFRTGDQVALEVIQACHTQRHVTHAGEVADRRAGALAHLGRDGARQRGAGADQCAMNGHGLGGILDATYRAQPSLGAQGIVRDVVGRAATADLHRVPVQYLIQEAHAALVRDVLLDPVAV